MKRVIVFGLFLVIVLCSTVSAQFTNGQSAVGVLGQTDFVTGTSGVSASQFNGPNGVAVDPLTGKLFVADRGNHRILRWASSDAFVNGSAAEAVFGQVDFTANTSGLAADKLNNPIGVFVDHEGRMWVGDYTNNRVLRFDDASNAATGASADGVLGQPDFVSNSSAVTQAGMSGPVGIYTDASGALWVSNFGSHRVLRYDDAASKTNGANADGVLGQLDFTTGTSGLAQDKLNNPNSVYVDANGNLYVSDFTNRRVVRFDDAANKANGANADGVIGQPDFVTNTSSTTRNGSGTTRFVYGDPAGRLYVVQESTHRMMIYNDAANLPNGPDADYVIGQPDFTTSDAPNPPNEASLRTPRAVFVDFSKNAVWLADWANHRLLRYEAVLDTTKTIELIAPNGGEMVEIGSTVTVSWSSQNIADVTIDYSSDNGQTWSTLATVPAIDGAYSFMATEPVTRAGRIAVYDAVDPALADTSESVFTVYYPSNYVFNNGQAASGVLGQTDFVTGTSGVSASQFNGPNGVAVDPLTGKLFVADRGNHRILRWASSDAFVNGSAAEAVFGQVDFTANASGLAADKLNNPIGVFVDHEGRMWVGDYTNNRVLRFDDASNAATGASADGVLGQPDFVSNSSAVTQAGMSGPVGIYTDATGALWVSNFGSHRVLRYDDAASKANGADADGVLGQLDFITGTSGLAQDKLNNPNSVYVDANGNLYVSDFTNRRVVRFDDAANKANGANADGVIGQPDFVTNTSNTTRNGSGTTRFVYGDPAGRLYVVQESTHRMMIYNDAANLPNGPDADYVIGQPDFTTSDAPNPPNEASLRTPRAVFVDPVSDAMWIADWANHRVLRHDLQREGVASLSLLAPNGGEVWITGSEQSIDWQSNSVNVVNLEFSADSGATWSPIADNVDAIPQTYLWTVPNVVTDNALVRITDAENTMLFDVSSAVFSTVLPFSSINLVSPNGYQEWESGKQKKILFTSANVDTAIIEYSDNGGANWTFVDAAPGTGEYIWTVPATQSNEYLIRISNKNEPSVRDTSDHTFSVVPAEDENQDIIFFSDSPTPSFYDPSWGFVNAPSTLQRVGEKFPVSTDYSLVGNYSLKLNWNSKPGGDWGMAVASMGWVGHDFTTYDTLEINVFTETAVDSAGLPVIYLEDLSNRKTPKVPMWNFVSSISENGWQTLYIPLQPFKDNPGTTDFTRIKTIFFGQNVADETQHTLYMDDVRIIGGEVINGDSTTVIVVLGSSTAAGTGPSSPDSAWVNRFRKSVQEHDSTAYVVNLAVGGFTTYNVMPTGFVPPANRPSPNPNNNITKALSYHPTAIVINLPSNDAANNYTVAEQLANYDTLLAQVPADIPVWITTTQPRNFSNQSQRDNLMAVRDSTFARFGDKAVDFWNGIATATGTIMPQYDSGDGIHINNAGHRIFWERVLASGIMDLVVGITEDGTFVPANFDLKQNYPNPFNGTTNFAYELPINARVDLVIYDVLGRKIATVENSLKTAGLHNVRWDATNISSGIYFYVLTGTVNGRVQFSEARKLLLVK